MKESIVKPLHKTAWVLFIILLFLNIVNWGFDIKDDLQQRKLPFAIKNGKAVEIEDSSLVNLFQDKEIIKIDTLQISHFAEQEDRGGTLIIFQTDRDGTSANDDLENALRNVLKGKKEVTVTWQDSLGSDFFQVNTLPSKDYSFLLNLGFNAVFLLFIFFNSFLLLKYSLHRENLLIVFFLLLLACPNRISSTLELDVINSLAAAFLGILFYQFVREKLAKPYKIRHLYLISFFLSVLCIILNKTLHIATNMVLYCWSLLWLLISFIILWKEYKATGSIELKRLLNAFKGLFVAIIALLIAIAIAGVMFVMTSGQTEFGINNLRVGILVGFVLIAMLVFIISILWFFGAFTWSLLTGTALGIKIRSTMIFTIVGVVFVVFFGLLDYSLGELLQTLFGRFLGSEFIAGIPATIGLLIFFNPVRQRVERLVDSKLNTSELDFLEKTDSFAETISGDSVIEGFEEYICENLIKRLPIEKVALISYDQAMMSYKFNEIRGSEVEENSPVLDVHLYLLENQIQRNYAALNENPQEIASFSLIIPILYDLDHKWFLALGKKNDGTSYTRKDEEALTKLADKIRLSLKFILAYDNIINNRYRNSLQEKNDLIANLQKQVAELAIKMSEKNISIEKS